MSTAVPPPPPAPPTADAPLPPPPPAPPAPRVRPGQLTRPWQAATVVMWGLTMLAFIGVWTASRQLGLATWWKGPESEPTPFVVMLVPFYLPAAVAVTAVSNTRWLPWLGVLAGAVTTAVGVGDLGQVVRFGVVEVALGVAGIVFSLASLSGRYRRAAASAPDQVATPAPPIAPEGAPRP